MGSGGGGSTSGMSDFPEYMKTFHSKMLDHTGTDALVISVTDAFNYCVSGNSPFYNFRTDDEPIAQAFMGAGKTINSYSKVFELLASFQALNFDTIMTAYNSGSSVQDLVDSVSTTLEDEININVLPRFKGNLRSIGAVQSSAYMVGEALIWDSKIKAVAKERLTIEQLAIAHKEMALKTTLAYMDFRKGIIQLTADMIKYYYALKTDLMDHYTGNHAKDLKWELDQYQYVNNVLSSISGAALSQGVSDKQPSKVASAIGGALSGAAMGAQMGGGAPGAAIGGILGLAGGL